MEVKAPFTKMTTEELFVVLIGGMAQISLQELVEECRKG